MPLLTTENHTVQETNTVLIESLFWHITNKNSDIIVIYNEIPQLTKLLLGGTQELEPSIQDVRGSEPQCFSCRCTKKMVLSSTHLF